MKILSTLFLSLSFTALLKAQCAPAMDDGKFSQIHAAVANVQDNKDQTIRDVTASNCLTSNQIGLLSTLYSQENERYNYLLFGRFYSSDPQNYGNLSNRLQDQGLRQQFLAAIAPAPPAQVLPPPTVPEQPQVALPLPTVPTPPQAPEVAPAPHSPLEGYRGRIGCSYPMDATSFAAIKKTLDAESFDSKKLSLFKQLTNGKCMSVAQLKLLLDGFGFESSKLDAAKSALGSTHDLDNFLALDAGFVHSSSKSDLSNHFAKNAERLTTKNAYRNEKEIKMMQGYSGRRGCELPMGTSEYDLVQKLAVAESFDAKRTAAVKNAVGNRCLSAEQVEKIAKMFTHDSYRLEFLKYAYTKTFDLDNFGAMESLFSFDSYKRDFRAILK